MKKFLDEEKKILIQKDTQATYAKNKLHCINTFHFYLLLNRSFADDGDLIINN